MWNIFCKKGIQIYFLRDIFFKEDFKINVTRDIFCKKYVQINIFIYNLFIAKNIFIKELWKTKNLNKSTSNILKIAIVILAICILCKGYFMNILLTL